MPEYHKNEQAVINFLEKNKIPFKKYAHKPVFTVEESKEIHKEIAGIHAKSLFLKDGKGRFYLCCIPAEKKLNTNSLRKFLKLGKLRFSTAEELLSELNLTPGSVSLFGMLNAKNTTLILDKALAEADAVGFHPNINTSTYVLSKADLEKVCKLLSPGYLVFEVSE